MSGHSKWSTIKRKKSLTVPSGNNAPTKRLKIVPISIPVNKTKNI